MKIQIDPHAGVCGGVRRAVRMVENRLRDQNNLVAIGPLIHNSAEVERLQRLGLTTVAQSRIEDGDFSAIEGEQVFVRSHGVSEKLMAGLRKTAAKVIDGTCPKVAAIQKLIRQHYEAGRQIVIIGKAGHPEVSGLNGFCENTALIIQSENDLSKIDVSRPIFLVSQTTISHGKYIDLMEKIVHIAPDVLAKDTVCRQVMNKDKELRNFAASVDVFLLVGGKHSSNTAVLYDIAKSVNASSFWIESEKDIEPGWISDDSTVGISGSASTPLWQIQHVRRYLQDMARPEIQDNIPANGVIINKKED